jgi:NNP family nitrate/nitrite transporter-like MFS transporter
MCIGFSHSYESFLLFRLAIGVIGASFVITQYHTSVMFAPGVVGTANATTAGWGNLGGGVTQMVMPLIFAGFVAVGYTSSEAWRISMVIPGLALLVMAFVYYFGTQDTPEGNISDLRAADPHYKAKAGDASGSFFCACRDHRVWVLFLVYGACFGIEITIDNIAALYFIDNFNIGIKEAGTIAGLFGFMNLFARALGGMFSDKVSAISGFKGRVLILSLFLLLEGLGIMLFSGMTYLPFAIATMLGFALFVKMSNGATYAVVPFINKKALGAVSGIVGAGGNMGAVLAGFLFKAENITYRDSLFIIGVAVAITAFISLLTLLPAFQSVSSTEPVLQPVFARDSSREKTNKL